MHEHAQNHTPGVTDGQSDLAATEDAYLGSVTFMSEGTWPLIKASASVSLGGAVSVPAQQSKGSRATRTNGVIGTAGGLSPDASRWRSQ